MLKTLGRSEEFMTVMDKYEYEKILHTEEGRQEVLEQGSEQTKIKMIKKFYKNGVDIEVIASSSDKSVEEILKNVA